ncbi:fatty acid desaturase [Gymnodinialimonas sp.]
MTSMDHKTLVAEMPPDVRAALTTCTDAPGVRQFAGHIGAIGVGAVLILSDVPMMALLMLVQGILISFLFTALHETTHRTPFKTLALNIWVGRICGAFVLIGPEWFRYFHLAHHGHTHDPDNDPELATPKPETIWQYAVYLSGLPDIAKRLTVLIRNATRPNRDAYVPEGAKPRIKTEARCLLAFYAGIVAVGLWFWTPAALLVWLLPLLMGGPFLRAYLLAEHARCPHAASMLDNTRTTLTTRLVRALAWNMPYHAEHHAYPAVPFHKLPAFHEHAKAHITHLQPGYVRFHRSFVTKVLSHESPP